MMFTRSTKPDQDA